MKKVGNNLSKEVFYLFILLEWSKSDIKYSRSCKAKTRRNTERIQKKCLRLFCSEITEVFWFLVKLLEAMSLVQFLILS